MLYIFILYIYKNNEIIYIYVILLYFFNPIYINKKLQNSLTEYSLRPFIEEDTELILFKNIISYIKYIEFVELTDLLSYIQYTKIYLLHNLIDISLYSFIIALCSFINVCFLLKYCTIIK